MSWRLGPTANEQPRRPAGDVLDETATIRWSVEAFEYEVEAFKSQSGSAHPPWPPTEPVPTPPACPPAPAHEAIVGI